MAALAPVAWLGLRALRGELGANPIEELELKTGWWGLTLLTVTLAVTPIRRLTHWNSLIRYRRSLGLFAFFYLTLHFLTYLTLDQFFAWDYIAEDILERPFISVGFAAWLILCALAITSSRKWIRRLGKRWRQLHSLIYVATALGVLHFTWKVKADTREPAVFGSIAAVLLAGRVVTRKKRASASPRG